MPAMARPGVVGGRACIVAAALLVVVGTARGVFAGPPLSFHTCPCAVFCARPPPFLTCVRARRGAVTVRRDDLGQGRTGDTGTLTGRRATAGSMTRPSRVCATAAQARCAWECRSTLRLRPTMWLTACGLSTPPPTRAQRVQSASG